MKKIRLLSSILFVSAALSLSACSLFNDDDIAVKNSYNPVASEPEEDPDALVVSDEIKGHRVDAVPNAYCFKNIGYANNGTILNTYKNGGTNENGFNPNSGADYTGDKTTNNYDLYVPDATPRNAKHTVILFVHGGAWVSGFKTDVNPYVHEFARRGYVTATIKYTLLSRTMDNPSLSIFRNLDEIDACIASIKEVLAKPGLDFDTTKTELVIGGASSGSHLAMLYSYSRGQDAPIDIKFVVDAVGPVNIKPDCWKSFKDEETGINAGLSTSEIDPANLNPLSIAGEKDEEGNALYWDKYQTMRIANGMCGLPNSKEAIEACAIKDGEGHIVDADETKDAAKSMLLANGGEDQLSVTYWMDKSVNKYPLVAAYAGKDTIVGVNQYATLQQSLEDNSIDYQYTYFKNSGHTQISKEADETAYNEFVKNVDDRCKA